MKYLHKFRHWIAHLFGCNYGHVETWHDGQTLMVGFRCNRCGKLSGEHPLPDNCYNSNPKENHE